jgi:predicted TIM-barrel fold metal-dependent hydrolase
VPAPITRVVDAHIHLWDPARTDRYPFLSGAEDLGMGDVSAMNRLFDLPTYHAETGRWNVEKVVHVTATRVDHVAETLELDALAEATGQPAAIVGAVVSGASRADTEAMLDAQAASPRFRGVRSVRGDRRLHTGEAHFPTRDALLALAERDLVYDLMVHPDQAADAADLLDGLDQLTVVVEHTGWPRDGSDEEFALWKAGIDRLAALHDQVHCKLSGLAMPLRTASVDGYGRWILHAIEVFGVERCFFASNFPVDGNHATFDELYSTYDALTAHLDDHDRTKLFATNAERVYRC